MILTIRTDKPESEIGLYEPDGRQIAYKKWQAHRELSATIHKVAYELLEANSSDWADIKGVVFFKGPGSFTGLRIGASVANALARSNQAPVSSQNGDDWIQKGTVAINLEGTKQARPSVALPEYGSEPRVTSQKK
jgi:tRNA threonylcarbamoyladenosine biosynthesis protein TsaB